jgi:hypothetical protein
LLNIQVEIQFYCTIVRLCYLTPQTMAKEQFAGIRL